MAYYYLLASMPLLVPGKAPAVTAEGFLAAAETALPESLFREVQTLMHNESGMTGHPFLEKVWDLEAQIINTQAERRAEERKTEPGEKLPYSHVDLSVIHGVNEAFQAENPLQRQRRLVSLRFAMLDDLIVDRPYGEEAVLAYAIKLRLALRLAGIDPEDGREAFRDMAERAVNNAGWSQNAGGNARSEA